MMTLVSLESADTILKITIKIEVLINKGNQFPSISHTIKFDQSCIDFLRKNKKNNVGFIGTLYEQNRTCYRLFLVEKNTRIL